MNGCSAIFLITSSATACGGLSSLPASAIIIGAMAKCIMFSTQKISATGTAAASPKASSAIPGPM